MAEPAESTRIGCVGPFFAVFAVLLVIGLIVSATSDDESGPSARRDTDREQAEFTAYDLCKEQGDKQLLAPGQSDYQPRRQVTWQSTGAKSSRWDGWVDAANAFGGQIRTDFTCTIRWDDDTVYATALVG